MARSATDLPFRLTMPYSVTRYITSERGVVTMLPGVRLRTIRLRRLPVSLVGRSHANERFSSFRRIGSAHELQLTARAADMAVPVRFRSSLSLQIDLSRVVDRDHTVILHDDVRGVCVIHRIAGEVCVTVGRCVLHFEPSANV